MSICVLAAVSLLAGPCVFVTLRDESALARFRPRGCEIRYRYRYAPVIVLSVRDPATVDRLAGMEGVVGVAPDRTGSGGLFESRNLIGADRTFRSGATGKGRVVAVLDTGVDTDHPDLQDAIIHTYHFLEQGTDVGPGAEDGNGHGTHVAGIIASRGRLTPRGIAPGARVIAVKVLTTWNRGHLSDWIAGVEHVVALHEADNGIRVDAINMSLETDEPFAGICDPAFPALGAACRLALEQGIALFASSGNGGNTLALRAPACLSAVYSVGSVRDRAPEAISAFTDRNAHLDLLAPGETITSTGLGGGTITFAGTSQAAAHVAGTACLLRECQPSLTPETLLATLVRTGRPIADPATGLTFPRLDALKAVEAVRNAAFRRGEANADGALDIGDALFHLEFLFGGAAAPPCLDAADANDDGKIDIADAVAILSYLHLGAAPLPEPFGACGADPTADALGCEGFSPCE